MIAETDEMTRECFAGRRLYGDDFGSDAIKEWYADEENAYFTLVNSNKEASENEAYGYDAFNQIHAFRSLGKRRFGTCLVFGCARGLDVKPLASRVDNFIALEPAEKWWRDEIGGTPARYVKPAINGAIPLANGSVELAISLGVLHHIPNVSYVVGEVARVLKPGGIFVVREPIISMGDWRRPRKGLTIHERGIPPKLLLAMLAMQNLRVTKASPVMIPIVSLLGRLLGIRYAYSRALLVRLDAFLSWLLWPNFRYHRVALHHKFAPTAMFIVAVKD